MEPPAGLDQVASGAVEERLAFGNMSSKQPSLLAGKQGKAVGKRISSIRERRRSVVVISQVDPAGLFLVWQKCSNEGKADVPSFLTRGNVPDHLRPKALAY